MTLDWPFAFARGVAMAASPDEFLFPAFFAKLDKGDKEAKQQTARVSHHFSSTIDSW
jgi:hypothetical protein